MTRAENATDITLNISLELLELSDFASMYVLTSKAVLVYFFISFNGGIPLKAES